MTYSTEEANALELAMEVHDECMKDNTTAPAGFGIAVSMLSDLLRISIKAAALIVSEELERREKLKH